MDKAIEENVKQMNDMLGVTEEDTVAHREVIDVKINKEGVYETSMGALEVDTNMKSIVYIPQEIHNLLVATKEELQKNFLKMGAFLRIIHDNKLYIELDSLTWQEYLDTPEIDLSRSQAYKLMAVYERWVEKWGYDPDEVSKVSIEKLYRASSQATDDNHEEWFEKARVLSRADLKASTPGSEQHYSMITCPYCGKDFELKPK